MTTTGANYRTPKSRCNHHVSFCFLEPLKVRFILLFQASVNKVLYLLSLQHSEFSVSLICSHPLRVTCMSFHTVFASLFHCKAEYIPVCPQFLHCNVLCQGMVEPKNNTPPEDVN